MKDAIDLQADEFNALEALITAYKGLPAIVDDGYPEARSRYEGALRAFARAVNSNRQNLRIIRHGEINNIDHISEVNRARAIEWHRQGSPWLSVDWSNAVAGEAGELCNVVKKIRRLETRVIAKRATENNMSVLIDKAAGEIADVYIYLDLTAAYFGIDLPEAIRRKFNATSEEFGFPHRL